MSVEHNELIRLCSSQLSEISELKNNLEKKEQEKYDLFKDLINGIIDVIDVYDRVVDNLSEKGMDKTEEGQKITSRYANIQKKLLHLLQKYGITPIIFPQNRIIIGWCKVIETETDSTKDNDTIVSVIKTGYHRGKELIREAEVVIVKN